jgi:hypothetical protein
MAVYNSETNGSKISKELLFEYFNRVIQMLKETKVQQYQDTPGL